MHDVFISYSRRDLEFVHKLHDGLVERGKDVWVDWEDIPPTAEWLEEVFDGIEASDNFVFVITPDSLASDVCARELGHAVEQHKRLIPVLRRNADGKHVPEALAARNWTFFRTEDDFAASLERLVAALDTDLAWVDAHTRLLGRSREWEKNGKDASFLLRGRDLEDAEQWVASQSPEREPRPTALQMEYVLASRSAATRRQRIVVGAALIGIVVASGLAVFAWSQRNEAVSQRSRAERQARLALSRQLAAESVTALGTDPEQSLVLAARAATTAGTNEARDALRRALRGSLLRSIVDAGTPVLDAEVDPKGRLVAAALEDGRVRVWNVRTGKPVVTLRMADAPVRSVSFSQNGRRVLGGGDAGVAVWSTSPSARRPFATFDKAGKPLAAALSPNGQLVATGDFDGVVRLWRAESGVLDGRLLLSGERWPVTAVAFSADGSRLVAANGLRTAVWSLRARSAPILQAHEKDWAVALSADGSRMATGDVDGVARVWNIRTKGAVELNGHEGAITSLAFSPDGASLVTASEDETARIWDAATGRSLAELRGHDGILHAAAFAPDGKTVVTGGEDGQIRTWATASDPVRAELAAPDDKTLRAVGFSPNGKLLVTGSEDLAARVWDIRSGRVLHVLRHGHADDEWVESAEFSRDGRRVVTAGDDGTAKVWDGSSGALLATLGRPGGQPLYDVALSPDGRIVAAAGGGPVVRLWRWRQRRLVMQRDGFTERVDGVAFSPAGGLFAAAGEKTVRVWRVGSGTPVAVLRSRERRDQLTTIAFAPSGELVAAGSSSGATWVWDVRTKKRMARLTGLGDTVSDVAFSADGRYLVVTAAHDGMANVWTVPGGHLVTALRTGASALEGAAFAPHGRSVAVAGAGGRVAVFECAECRPLPALVCLAASRVTPQVRARERKTFGRCD